MIWLLRMAKWTRHPPSAAMVKMVIGIILVGLLLAGIEHIWGWPEALTPNGHARRGLRP